MLLCGEQSSSLNPVLIWFCTFGFTNTLLREFVFCFCFVQCFFKETNSIQCCPRPRPATKGAFCISVNQFWGPLLMFLQKWTYLYVEDVVLTAPLCFVRKNNLFFSFNQDRLLAMLRIKTCLQKNLAFWATNLYPFCQLWSVVNPSEATINSIEWANNFAFQHRKQAKLLQYLKFTRLKTWLRKLELIADWNCSPVKVCNNSLFFYYSPFLFKMDEHKFL